MRRERKVMKNKLFVLSMDAMVGEDVAYLRRKPNFDRLMKNAARVEQVRTVYPSITYPAHVSIMTGCCPGTHGIYTNTHVHAEKPRYPDWHLYSGEIRVENLFAAAKRVGCTTASVYWPVTGCDENVDYLINEYFFYEGEDVEATFRAMGTSEETLVAVRENRQRLPDRLRKPDAATGITTFNSFINGCVCSLIRHYQPDVFLVHNCILDTLRHHNGAFHEAVLRGLDQTDIWLGEIAAAMEDAGVLADTNFVILSDHGQMDFVRRLKVNTLLRRGGFLDVDENGHVTDWRACAQSNGMSVTVFVKDGDKSLEKEVHDYLKKLQKDGVWGFERIHTREEVKERYGLDGDFSFVLETDGYTSFSDGCDEPLIQPIDLSDYRLGKATHGYEPEKGPQPVFIAAGPAFEPGAVLPAASVLDEAPTLAAVIGAQMPQAEGSCLCQLLAARHR